MKKYLAAMFILTLLIAQTSAYTYLNIYLDSNGNAEFLGETNETNSTLSLPVGIELTDGKIRGTTQTLTTKRGDTWTFTYHLINSDLKIVFPEGTTIESAGGASIFEERNKISAYTKNSVLITYNISEVQGSNTLWVWLTLLALALIVAFFILRSRILSMFKPKVVYKKSNSKKSNSKIIKQILNSRENEILEKLKTTGKIKMSHLRRLCDIPKASFSRHLQELEKKKLILRTGEGKNKFVALFNR